MIETILTGLMPVAFGIALGWLAGWTGMLKHADADVLATLVIRIALPFALFAGAVHTSPDKLANWDLALCLTFGLMGGYLIALFVGRYVFKHDLRTATMQALVCGFPDMAYFGAPVLAAMFGAEGFLPVVVGNLITSLLMLPLTVVLTSASDKREAGHDDAWLIFRHSLLAAATNPIVCLPILGAVLSFSHVSLPGPIFVSVDTIGRAAAGTGLFALGLMLYGEPFKVNADVLTNIAIKNFLQPALMALAVAMLGLSFSSATAKQAIITGAVPTATAAAMFALKAKTYTAEATSTILIGTILGIGTAAILMAVLTAAPWQP